VWLNYNFCGFSLLLCRGVSVYGCGGKGGCVVKNF
jgi:hypothetical protein